MARRTATEEQAQQLKTMDFERAVELYRGDIKPALSESASQNQVVDEAYKVIKKECHIQPQSAKAAIKASEMEDARRDDHLRGFCGMLNQLVGFELVTFHGRDLIDSAEGDKGRPQMKLVGIDDEGDDFEAGDAELAAQTGRPSVEKAKAAAEAAAEDAPKPGTGAAAVKAMKGRGEKAPAGAA